MVEEESKVWWFALQSRFALFGMQLIFNTCVPDHKADAFNPPIIDQDNWNFVDKCVDALLGGLIRWDAVYFIHISEHGYTYENCLAFLPLYPCLVRLLGNSIFLPLQTLMTYRSVLIITAVLLNQVLFVQTAVVLYKLGRNILRSDLLAYKAALLLCISPASIFMSAAYSEILFCYLVFTGMLNFERNYKLSASFIFGLSAVARSNGILYLGLLIHTEMKSTIKRLMILKGGMKYADKWTSIFSRILCELWTIIIPVVLYLILIIAPFLGYQYLAYRWFCTSTAVSLHIPVPLVDYGRSQGYHVRGDNSSTWCNNNIPFVYSYIQKSHWNVGFLSYYEFKQIPNFLLATPVTVLSVSAIVYYIRLNRRTVCTLDLLPEDFIKTETKESDTVNHRGFRNRQLLPYIVHLSFLTMFGWLFTHVQILTRMLLSSSPILYWFAAHIVTPATSPSASRRHIAGNRPQNDTKDSSDRNILINQILTKGQDFRVNLIFTYFIGYLIIGTFLFSNSLPWT